MKKPVACVALAASPPHAPRRLILANHQSPGDIIMLTAAVRDLHHAHPGAFLTDIRSSCPPLWDHNPHLTALDENMHGIETVLCDYPLIHESNTAPYHFIHGFMQFLNGRLGTQIRPTAFRGDIHLSAEERAWPSQMQEETGSDGPFWILAAGGKYDYTIKWWDPRRFQDVVDHFQGRIRFAQVGERRHHHPPLRGVVDLRGRTDLRQLVRLVHHAAGILTPVSLLMHLAAAVPTRDERPRNRACVVVAGGREPTQWEAYPSHQFLHTIGALQCCETGGCWRSRTVPLRDGDVNDQPDRLCVDVAGYLPRCMHLITARHVIDRIELYLAHPRLAATA